MPWYCGKCNQWNRSAFTYCPTCQRPAKSRRCFGCDAAIPDNATACPYCTGTKLSKPPLKVNPFRPFPVPVRLGALLGVVVVGWLAYQLLRTVVPWLLYGLWYIAVHLIAIGVVFWIFTAVLPDEARRNVRSGAWWLISALFRFLKGLVS